MIVTVNQSGGSFERDLSKLGAAIRDPSRALHRIGALLKDESRLNAPKSPTMQELKRSRLAGKIRAFRAAGIRGKAFKAAITTYKRTARKISAKLRKPDAKSRPMPGRLTDSIEFQKMLGEVSIYCASNSRAGKYARYIHDGGPHGSGEWQNRGAGTVRKGARADDKFIERAVNGNDEKIRVILESEIAKQAGPDIFNT
jgi:hypothetical protein